MKMKMKTKTKMMTKRISEVRTRQEVTAAERHNSLLVADIVVAVVHGSPQDKTFGKFFLLTRSLRKDKQQSLFVQNCTELKLLPTKKKSFFFFSFFSFFSFSFFFAIQQQPISNQKWYHNKQSKTINNSTTNNQNSNRSLLCSENSRIDCEARVGVPSSVVAN